MRTSRYTRREMIANIFRASACATAGVPFWSAGQGRRGAGQDIESFERQFRVPAMSLAITKGGRFVFDRAGGMADREHVVQAQQDTLFRIADLSKPITAVTIFLLIQSGKLHLNDKVFGASGVLGTRYGNEPLQPYVADVTVDHLLTHTAGGWAAGDSDPMYHNDGWDPTKLIDSTIENVPLTSQPGTQWAYSNFGYCVLGRVIEAITGQPYEAYVQANILGPCGISTMQIANNSERHRAADEVVYIGQYSEDPYKINVSRMDSTAGWIASSTQLVQFLNHVAGAPGIPALLRPETVRAMTTPAAVYPQGNVRCARGWMVADGGATWFHSGSLPGSTALMVRAANTCSAAICNTRTEPHAEMDDALQAMMSSLTERIA